MRDEKLTNITKLQNINFVVSSSHYWPNVVALQQQLLFIASSLSLALSAIIIYYDDIY